MLCYLHGYSSTPNSTKGKLLRDRFNAIVIDYHQGTPESLDVEKSLRKIARAIEGDADPVLIGSSFGGFLAAETALNCIGVKTIVLLNPAIIPPGADTQPLIGIPRSILERMRDDRLFTTKLYARVVILVGTRDVVIPVDWAICFAKSQEACVRFLDDDHAFAGNPARLLNVVEEVLLSRNRLFTPEFG
jgi:pimeloyl-ACP methyl ester carboxylesterase